MTPLAYAQERGWPVFPLVWRGSDRKKPIVDKELELEHGFHDATLDREHIERIWCRYPSALIGIPTGKITRIGILDIDVKNPRKYGPDSLEALGHSIAEVTWIVHTPSGGWHRWYDPGYRAIPSTTHKLGPGLDTRFEGGYLVAPSPGSGYCWDLDYNPDTIPLASAPVWLIPPEPKPAIARGKPIKPVEGLSPYADAAIERACQAIRHAPDGLQRETLRDQSFSIGTLAGAGGIPADFARRALIDAGCGMPSYDPHKPWTEKEVIRVVDGCFAAGLARPRSLTGGRAAR
jgi:hypothetical protein